MIQKGFNIVSEAETDVFLEFSCFFYDPTDVGNLNSGSSVFSKPSFNILEGHHTQRIAIDKQIDRKIYKYMDI